MKYEIESGLYIFKNQNENEKKNPCSRNIYIDIFIEVSVIIISSN